VNFSKTKFYSLCNSNFGGTEPVTGLKHRLCTDYELQITARNPVKYCPRK